MKKKYSKLRRLLRDALISTHPGEVVIQTDDRHELFELLTEIGEEGDAELS